MSNSRCGGSCRHAEPERLPSLSLPAEGASPDELHRCFESIHGTPQFVNRSLDAARSKDNTKDDAGGGYEFGEEF